MPSKITLQGTHRKHKNSFRKTSFTKFVSTKTSFGKTSFTTFDSTKSWENFFYNIFPPTKFFEKNFFYKSCSNKNTPARTSFTKLVSPIHSCTKFSFPKNFIQQKWLQHFFSAKCAFTKTWDR